MKANIHPDYHEITVVMTNGTKYQMRTTYGKAGDVMNLDIDPLTHPAWNADMSGKVIERGQLSKFENRFGGFLSAGASAAKAPAENAEEKKEEKKKK